MIHVKNWSKYQSYKDRKPPWIRFHRSILDDFKFQSMSAESRALLPMIWLLACEDEDPTSGLVRASYEEIVFRLRIRTETFTECLRELQAAEFIECIESVQDSYKGRNETVPPESETDKKDISSDFDSFWEAYPRKVGKGTAKKAYAKAVRSASPEQILSGVQAYKANKPSYADWAHPTTWLNAERWSDVYAEDKPKRNVPDHFNPDDWGVGVGNA